MSFVRKSQYLLLSSVWTAINPYLSSKWRMGGDMWRNWRMFGLMRDKKRKLLMNASNAPIMDV